MAKLVMMQGISGSGKSTIAYYNVATADTVIVNLDAIREELTGDAANQSANKEVVAVAQRRTRNALMEGKTVIVDSTLIKNDWLDPWLAIANDCGASVGIVLVRVKLATALARNAARNAARQRQVPEHIIVRQHTDLQSFLYGGFDVQVIEND